jgi:hypothetical protein
MQISRNPAHDNLKAKDLIYIQTARVHIFDPIGRLLLIQKIDFHNRFLLQDLSLLN